jgi:ferredoxin-NADP reductase
MVSPQRDVCLLAGGTGFTAFAAFLAQLPAEHAHRVLLFYGARSPALLIYRALAAEFAARCPRGEAFLFAEQGAAGDPGLIEGRVDIDHVWPRLSQPMGFTFYIAGPPAMIEGLTSGLKAKGVGAECIVIDAWE